MPRRTIREDGIDLPNGDGVYLGISVAADKPSLVQLAVGNSKRAANVELTTDEAKELIRRLKNAVNYILGPGNIPTLVKPCRQCGLSNGKPDRPDLCAGCGTSFMHDK